jgi:competence protein ComEC
MNSVKVNKIYLNDLNHQSNASYNIYRTASEKGVKQILVQNGQTVYENGGLRIVNLNNYSGKSDNDNSIITLLTYNDFSMLFTGDAGINGINSALAYIPKNITVLKVPHHGAVGGVNKDLISYLAPKYSLVSTGENQFGHPSIYTLELLKNSVILRTDVNNSIKFVVNKKGLKVLSYDVKSKKYKNSFEKKGDRL